MDWTPVRVRYYDTPISAAPDRAALEEAGIPTVLQDGEFISMEWQMHRAVGGTKIAVPADRLAEAEELLGGVLEPGADGVADWLSAEERAANRVQMVGVISLVGEPLVPYFWYLWWRFHREHPRPEPHTARKVRRGAACALVASVILVALILAIAL